ncbi:Ypel1, partial [Columba guinea]
CFFCQRVQQSCNSSSASPELSEEPPAEMVKMTKSKTFQAYLPNCHRTYSCIHCRAHLANHDELISKASDCLTFFPNACYTISLHNHSATNTPQQSFQGSQGRAYLFNSVVNVGCGPAEERVLLTGLHAVADIYCENCKTTLGWKYEHAFESSQKYKEGKFIIELAHMIKDNGWE